MLEDMTIRAADIRAGDSLYSRNGYGYCSLAVLGCRTDPAAGRITVMTRGADIEYAATDQVEISRWN